MSDLISRSKLIEQLLQAKDDEIIKAVIGLVQTQPTAYDTEAVIDELEYLRVRHEGDRNYWAEHSWRDNSVYNECDLNDRQEVCFEQAIDIVRKGGVE